MKNIETYLKEKELAEKMMSVDELRLSQVRINVRKNQIANKIVANLTKYALKSPNYSEEGIKKHRGGSYHKGSDEMKKEATIIETLFGDSAIYFKMLIAEILVDADIYAKQESYKRSNSMGSYIFSFDEGEALKDQDYLDIAGLVSKKAILLLAKNKLKEKVR
ncbi:MAG TPA: hypothetical protein DIT25_00460 [Candidatus Moranbacteria bacterium]|nr:hypothetical protein [Candidatus Moranbacteria bacterium]